MPRKGWRPHMLSDRFFQAVLMTVALIGTASAQSEKKPKDQGEYELYNQVIKDSSNPSKQLQQLDTWAEKYPDSDYKDERLFFYLSAYNGTNQPAKAVDTAGRLLSKDLNAAFKDPRQIIAV